MEWIGFGFDLDLIWIEIGIFKNFKEYARSACNGNHFSKLWINTWYHFPSEDEVVIIVNSLLYIHYLCGCSEHHLLVVTVTREIITTQWWSSHQCEYKKGKIKCIDLHYYVVVSITIIHFRYQLVMIVGSNVHFKSSDVHYSVFTVHV